MAKSIAKKREDKAKRRRDARASHGRSCWAQRYGRTLGKGTPIVLPTSAPETLPTLPDDRPSIVLIPPGESMSGLAAFVREAWPILHSDRPLPTIAIDRLDDMAIPLTLQRLTTSPRKR